MVANYFYPKGDKVAFENQVKDRVGQLTRLVLVQTPGYFGEEAETDWSKIFSREEPAKQKEINFPVLYDRLDHVVEQLWLH